MARDCARLAIPPIPNRLFLEDLNHLPLLEFTGVLKILVTRGTGGRGYRSPIDISPTRVLSLHHPPVYPTAHWTHGVELRICNTPLAESTVLAGSKHMNRLEQVLARSEWSDEQVAEGIMLDTSGRITEGTMSNLFIVRSGRVFTPKLDRCGVSGVMRSMVMKGFNELGIPITEARLWVRDLKMADEVFVTNSVIGIWPVRKIGCLDFKVGALTLEVTSWLEENTGMTFPPEVSI